MSYAGIVKVYILLTFLFASSIRASVIAVSYCVAAEMMRAQCSFRTLHATLYSCSQCVNTVYTGRENE